MKIYSITLVMRKMQIKNHFIPSTMAKIKQTRTSVSKDVEKLAPLSIAGGIAKWFSHGTQFGRSLKS